MSMEIMVNGTTAIETLKDKNLIASANRIVKASDGVRKSLFAIAYELYRIDCRGLYKADGYKNTAECAGALFGYKKAMVSNLVRIAKNYVDASTKQCLLPPGKTADGVTLEKPWTVGQLQEVISLDPGIVREMVDSGKLNSSMTAKQIRDVVKAYKNGGALPSAENAETAETAENLPPVSDDDSETETAETAENPIATAKQNAVNALKRLLDTLPDGTVYRENVTELLDSLSEMEMESLGE